MLQRPILLKKYDAGSCLFEEVEDNVALTAATGLEFAILLFPFLLLFIFLNRHDHIFRIPQIRHKAQTSGMWGGRFF